MSRVLADGALGTELLRRGVPPSTCLEAATVTHTELVRSVHRAYREAGADILTTNTFGANQFRLARHGLEDRMAELNWAAAQLTRSVAGTAQVAGSIGPSGVQDTFPPIDRLQDAFRRQAAALAAAGVDLYICETFGDARELRAAVLGIQDVSALPIVACMTVGNDGRTPTGMRPSDVVGFLGDLNVAAIGANCCIGESTIEYVVSALTELTAVPIVAIPNAGQPITVGATWQYPVGPQQFGELIARLSTSATIMGGCCGTTPEHIAAARAALSGVGMSRARPTT